MASSESVPTFRCLGGCGSEIDAEAHPDGLCPDCRTDHRPEPDPDLPHPWAEGFERRAE